MPSPTNSDNPVYRIIDLVTDLAKLVRSHLLGG
jgi:hypothetical protein